jgi:hypothetical protein
MPLQEQPSWKLVCLYSDYSTRNEEKLLYVVLIAV